MKLLHTSDWHLGRSLYFKKRYDEFDKFLDWFILTIDREKVDGVLISGDVFDTGTPSNRSQEQYYWFLRRVAGTCCRNVIITAGNHDSPTFLNAPRELLKAMNVYVVGAITNNPDDEIIVIRDKDGEPECIVCAVPYLRDSDVRESEPGEDAECKQRRLIDGIRNHFNAVVQRAGELREHCSNPVPVVVMGHLFTTGGQIVDGDGIRELAVGSLARVPADIFTDKIAYTALGHLHVPQAVSGVSTIRYSGSPLPIGFGETMYTKSVSLVTLTNNSATVDLIPVPQFQKLARITGTLEELQKKIDELKHSGESVWVEALYTGNEVVGNLRQQLDENATGSAVILLNIKNTRITEQVLSMDDVSVTLDTLRVDDVFDRCLEEYGVDMDQRDDLRSAFQEIHTAVLEGDYQAN